MHDKYHSATNQAAPGPAQFPNWGNLRGRQESCQDPSNIVTAASRPRQVRKQQQRPAMMPAGWAHREWKALKDVQKGHFSPAAQPGSSGIPPAESHELCSTTSDRLPRYWEHAAAAMPGCAWLPRQDQEAAAGGMWDEGYQRQSRRERLLELHPAFPGTGPAGRWD